MRKHIYQEAVPVQEPVPDHPLALTVNLPEPPNGDHEDQAFLYRIKGKLTGFFNRCGHVRLPMDLDDGKFFDLDGMIICRVHGARFDEEHGQCLMGPAYTGLYRLIISDHPSQNTDSDLGTGIGARNNGTQDTVWILGWEGPVPPSS